MAMFVHHGKANFGHYWVNLKHGQQWFRISDSQVSLVTEAQAIREGQGEAETSAYALIYRRVNDQALSAMQVDLTLAKALDQQLLA
jgi:ubiquitin C-terminal hydrolase